MRIYTISGDECFSTLDNNGYILYYFTANWCKPCQSIWNDIIEISDRYTTILFYKIDIDDEDNNEICEKCNIKSIPSFFLFNNRNFIQKMEGANIDRLKDILDKIKG
tara:strand:- start:1082 stop:1402 length:321 start_codon:yes stop_codon:yes gene_type:complete